jgi:hypothetical protein
VAVIREVLDRVLGQVGNVIAGNLGDQAVLTLDDSSAESTCDEDDVSLSVQKGG